MTSEPFVHPNALCESQFIGEGTRIWAFAHILPQARIGKDSNICDNVFIENDVIVGDRVTIKCGVQLWDGIRLADDVFVGPNATFTNDRFPRSKVYPERFLETKVGRGASVGANATILPGIEIGAGAMIGAGAVVTRSVPPNAIVVGNPGRITGYVDALAGDKNDTGVLQRNADNNPIDLGIGTSRLYPLRHVRDLRGSLVVGEVAKDVPFGVKRFFLVFDVATQEVRGEHAHRQCKQFLVCLRGSVNVLLDNGEERREFTLDRPDIGIYMPEMIWGTQYKYSNDAILLVLASQEYNPEDYIRNYDEYVTLMNIK